MKTIFLHGEMFESFGKSSFCLTVLLNVNGKARLCDTPLV